MPKNKRDGKPEWYPLDNAGVLYSALQKEKYSAIYRFSAVMAERVDRDALQRAVDKTMPRFPSFGVRIKKGAFWYYFEPNSAPGPFVKEDISNPCQPVRFREDNGWLVRFYYYEKRISVEVFHAVSDGGGALVFFKTLLAVYLRELGYSIPNTHGILDVAEEPRRAEREDAYGRYATVRPRREKRGKKAYQNNGTAEPFYTFNVTMGFCSVARLKEKARGYGVSITEYLTAVLLKVIADKQHRERPRRERPVALAIPINLRGWFPSETLRNFILTVRPSIDPSLGEYTFEEVLSQVHHYLRLNINRQQMQAAMLWLWLVPPLLARGMHLLLRLLLDIAAVALYVYLISVDLNGGDWYLGLAAPIILWGGAILLLLGLVLRVYRRSALTTLTILIGSIGVFVFGMEFFVDRWLHQLWSPSWSLVVLTICIGMVIPLIIIRRVPALREEARRRFHL